MDTDKKLNKKDVLNHRNVSHQIFLTTFALIVGLNTELNAIIIDMLIIISVAYFLVIYQNLYRELFYVKKKIEEMTVYRKSITLMLPIAICFSLVRTEFEWIDSTFYFIFILDTYFVSLWVMIQIYINNSKELKEEKNEND